MLINNFTENNNLISIKNITLRYENISVFDNFSIEFEKHKINVILGPSGCGKTSILNIVANNIKNKAFVFQEHRLLPHLNCYDNIDFILEGLYKDKEKRKSIIEYNIKNLGLINSIKLKPSQLSGGMKQRLSLARAFAYNSDLLLMDEPLQGLDIKRKKELIDIIKNNHTKENNTIIYVVHDVTEALMLADNIFVLSSSPYTKIIYSKNIEGSNRDITSKYMLKVQRDVINHLLK